MRFNGLNYFPSCYNYCTVCFLLFCDLFFEIVLKLKPIQPPALLHELGCTYKFHSGVYVQFFCSTNYSKIHLNIDYCLGFVAVNCSEMFKS